MDDPCHAASISHRHIPSPEAPLDKSVFAAVTGTRNMRPILHTLCYRPGEKILEPASSWGDWLVFAGRVPALAEVAAQPHPDGARRIVEY